MISNIIAIAIILLLLGFSTAYIIKEKRKGTKCIGCPSSCTCSHKHKH